METELDYDQASDQVLLCGEAIGRPPDVMERVKRQLAYGVGMSDRLAAVYHLIETVGDACPSCGSQRINWKTSVNDVNAGRCGACAEYLLSYKGEVIRVKDGQRGFRKVNNLLADQPVEVSYPEKDMVANGTKPKPESNGIDYKAADRYYDQHFTQPKNAAALRAWQRQLRDLEIARKYREVKQ